MSRRGRIARGYRIEDWHGEILYVDAAGLFFVMDSNSQRGTEATTLDVLKRKLAGPHTTLDLQGIIFHRDYEEDEDGDPHLEVHVYGLSGVGNVLYEHRGRKEKAEVHTDVYVFDETRVAERLRLRREKRRVTAELEALMANWPKVERKVGPP